MRSRPNPPDQGIQVRLDDGTAVLRILSGVDQVEIFHDGGAVRNDGRGLPAGLVETLLREHGRDLLPIFVDVENGPLAGIIWFVVLGVGTADQRVGTNRHFVAEAQLLLGVLVEGDSGKADHSDDNAKVNDVSAVTARVAARQQIHAVKDIAVVVAGDHQSAANELAADGGRYQHGKGRNQQQHVIEQEARLARNQRLELVFTFEMRAVAHIEEGAGSKSQREEDDEVRAYV